MKSTKLKTKTEKGITLIALIITIVVLMILAAVAISSIQNNGIIGYAEEAKNKYNTSQRNEQGFLNDYSSFLNNVLGEGSGSGSLKFTVAKIAPNYVSGYSLIKITGTEIGYLYNGKEMYKVGDYFLYIVEGAVDKASATSAITVSATANKEIVRTYDVNCDYVSGGEVDLKDATMVHACIQLDLDVDSYMDSYIRSDVNNDDVVNADDKELVVANYT